MASPRIAIGLNEVDMCSTRTAKQFRNVFEACAREVGERKIGTRQDLSISSPMPTEGLTYNPYVPSYM
eukprot:3027307-Amphidinium_carterae.1